MISPTRDADVIKTAIGDYEVVDFDCAVWLDHPHEKAIALTNGHDVSLFQWERKGTYFGHWFFTSRGKAAKTVAIEMLDYLFEHYPVEIIIGFTPMHKLGARWLARHIGFKSQGPVFWKNQDLEFFMMTKNEWTNR